MSSTFCIAGAVLLAPEPYQAQSLLSARRVVFDFDRWTTATISLSNRTHGALGCGSTSGVELPVDGEIEKRSVEMGVESS